MAKVQPRSIDLSIRTCARMCNYTFALSLSLLPPNRSKYSTYTNQVALEIHTTFFTRPSPDYCIPIVLQMHSALWEPFEKGCLKNGQPGREGISKGAGGGWEKSLQVEPLSLS